MKAMIKILDLMKPVRIAQITKIIKFELLDDAQARDRAGGGFKMRLLLL